MYLNLMQIVGRATRDVELNDLGNSKVTTFRIVSNKRIKKQDGSFEERATFIDCEAWGQRAEFASKFIKKGMRVYVSGELEQDEWENKAGERRQKHKIYVQVVRIVDLLKKTSDEVEATNSGSNDLPF